jgi:hypothetical protein
MKAYERMLMMIIKKHDMIDERRRRIIKSKCAARKSQYLHMDGNNRLKMFKRNEYMSN